MIRRRPLVLAACASAALAAVLPAWSQTEALAGNPIKTLLAQASDAALDRLAQPGAFSADSAIRIGLPGLGGRGAGQLLSLAGQAGVTGGLDAALNRAAEQAAARAKPIFRAAIDRASLRDSVDIVRGGTGATDYLRRSAGGDILAQLRPLVQQALQSSGALNALPQLRALGMDEARLTEYVAGKTSDGIFTYVGREETRLRQNPIGAGQELLKGMRGLGF